MIRNRSSVARLLQGAALLVAFNGCDPHKLLVQEPEGGMRPVGLQLALSPAPGPSASQAAAWRAADRVWLHLGNESVTVLDSIFPFDPQAQELALRVQVQVPEGEALTLTVELRSGVGVVMRAVQPADLDAAVTVAMEVQVSSTTFSISAGNEGTCALSSDQRAYCWGANHHGELGDPSVPWIGSPTPVAVTGDISFRSLSFSANTVCGLDLQGRAYCWGRNNRGQVGNGTVADAWPYSVTAPVAVAGGLTFASLSAGGSWPEETGHTCAITPEGTAYCWGTNQSGELGSPSGGYAPTPVEVSGGHRFRSVSAGAAFTCGVTVEGEGYCWGRNVSGQLGDGTFTGRHVPTRISGDLEFLAIEAGLLHACGIVVGGAVYCWGSNWGAQLGIGVRGPPVPTPQRVHGALTFQSVSVGNDMACAVTPAGEGYCWGNSWHARLGTGSLDDSLTPTPISGNLRWVAVSVGDAHGCGLAVDGTAYCWGQMNGGKLGEGSIGYSTAPSPVSGGADFLIVATSQEHACAVDASGRAYCWGANYEGRLGIGAGGASTSTATPVAVATDLTFSGVTTGAYHSCGVTTARAAYCWGRGEQGALGNAGFSEWAALSPIAVDGALSFQRLAAGGLHTCGITVDGAAYCWGRNDEGQLGNGSTASSRVPVPVADNLVFTDIRAASNYTCAVATGGAAYCWGANDTGQLGDGTTTQRNSPVPVAGGIAFQAVSPSGETETSLGSTCGISTTGDLFCWGTQRGCQLGNGNCDPIPQPTPLQVGTGRQYRTVSMGIWVSCALATDGGLYCWGGNNHGQTGYPHQGYLHPSPLTDPGLGVPTLIPVGITFEDVAAGSDYTCGIASGGGAWCWGGYGIGHTGAGQVNYVAQPTPVAGGLNFN